MAPYYSKAYLSAQVDTTDRVGVIVSLYEGALGHVRQAMDAIEAGDVAKRGQAIGKAGEILMGLCEGIDFTQEGTLPGELFSLYNFQLRQLLEANRENDLEALQTVHGTLSILLDGWRHASSAPETAEIREADRQALARPEVAGRRHAANRPSLVMTA